MEANREQLEKLFSPKPQERYIIMSDFEQEMPQRIKVETFEVKESSGGKQYVQLNCIDEDRMACKVSVFKRDVQRCVEQWGINPSQWGWMKLEPNFQNTRYKLVPHADQVDPE